ncbi:DUF397 domain-containing protein [Nocardia sp. CDC153]|uniref:DUF397 domain-containing protein n=1 Tax=Nocardia sp. CDC153 TaxID=3112167 RepID=UPI003FA368C9
MAHHFPGDAPPGRVTDSPARQTLVRDTKDGGRGPVLEFPADMWAAFIESGIYAR